MGKLSPEARQAIRRATLIHQNYLASKAPAPEPAEPEVPEGGKTPPPRKPKAKEPDPTPEPPRKRSRWWGDTYEDEETDNDNPDE